MIWKLHERLQCLYAIPSVGTFKNTPVLISEDTYCLLTVAHCLLIPRAGVSSVLFPASGVLIQKSNRTG